MTTSRNQRSCFTLSQTKRELKIRQGAGRGSRRRARSAGRLTGYSQRAAFGAEASLELPAVRRALVRGELGELRRGRAPGGLFAVRGPGADPRFRGEEGRGEKETRTECAQALGDALWGGRRTLKLPLASVWRRPSFIMPS